MRPSAEEEVKASQLLVEEADASGQKTDIAKGSSIVCRKELFQGRSAEQQHPAGTHRPYI